MACNEFFNRVESLLRRVLKCSETDNFFRRGQRCLEGVWAHYATLINFKFTPSQRETINFLTHAICHANKFADLARFRPGSPPSPYLPVSKLELDSVISDLHIRSEITSMMVQIYDFE